MSSEVRLQPTMPAIWTMSSTSPLRTCLPSMASNTSGETSMIPVASAMREVNAFSETSTMRALPLASKVHELLGSVVRPLLVPIHQNLLDRWSLGPGE